MDQDLELKDLKSNLEKIEELVDNLTDSLESKQKKIDYLKDQIESNVKKIDEIINKYNEHTGFLRQCICVDAEE